MKMGELIVIVIIAIYSQEVGSEQVQQKKEQGAMSWSDNIECHVECAVQSRLCH